MKNKGIYAKYRHIYLFSVIWSVFMWKVHYQCFSHIRYDNDHCFFSRDNAPKKDLTTIKFQIFVCLKLNS